jgi:hypothetical protein
MTYIYCLYKNNIPFYVGKSNNLKHRKYDHMKKYGKDIILEELDKVAKDAWIYWEKWWIALFKSWGFKLINENNGGGGCVGNELRNIKSANWKKLPVVQWDKNQNPIKIWRCAKDVELYLGINSTLIGMCCKGTTHTASGFYWSYVGNIPRLYPHKKSIPVTQYTLNNIKIKEWESAKNAGKNLNINYKAICNNLNNRAKSAGGFIWKYT